MSYIIICSLVLGAFYSWFLYQVRNNWILNSALSSSSDSSLSHVDVSVIVIVRNEEDHIESCLRSILNNPSDLLTEIIVVDDHSDDKTIDLIHNIEDSRITLLYLSDFELLTAYPNKFKKAALHFALTRCHSELILTTDGDCIVGPNWISSMITQHLIHQSDCTTGPILMSPAKGLIGSFQQIEMIGTMAVTMMGISSNTYSSANAANMLFSRIDYLRFLHDYDHRHASGDDLFFIQWQQNLAKKLCFAFDREAIVRTEPLRDIRSLYSQRLRWASKTSSYPQQNLTLLMAVVFFFHFSILISTIYGIFSWHLLTIYLSLLLLLTKCLVDFYLLRTVAPFFGLEYRLSLRSIGLSMTHICYIVLVGVAGLMIKNYTWKGRKVS